MSSGAEPTAAVIAVTAGGSRLAGRIAGGLEGARAFVPERFAADCPGCAPYDGPLANHVGAILDRHRRLVFVMATGIVVRFIAPYIKDKLTDPAVVVVDEAGRHAISLLSGHVGGANRLAEVVAEIIGATPVITTASEAVGTISVDMLAAELGLLVEDHKAAKRVTAACVNGEPVGLLCDIDPERLASVAHRLTKNIRLLSKFEDLAMSGPDAAILITARVYPPEELGGVRHIAYLRPKTLVVGIGCNRGTPAHEFAQMFDETLRVHGLSPLSVRHVASIADKSDEAGLLAFAVGRGLEIDFIDKARLNQTEPPSGRSGAAMKYLGVNGVCEPAALISAERLGKSKIIVQKRKSKNVTMAVAEASSAS